MLVVVCVAQTQEDREAKLARLEELKKRNSELKEELKQYIDFDPELIDDMGNQLTRMFVLDKLELNC